MAWLRGRPGEARRPGRPTRETPHGTGQGKRPWETHTPREGTRIRFDGGRLSVPDDPIILFIEGDGIGPDIWAASVRVLDEAVAKAFGGKKRIVWDEIFVGEKAQKIYGEALPEGTVVIKDRIADSMLRQILTRTDEYELIATPTLNGDYLSDACAAQVGGLGIAPGANIGLPAALFEATYGTAPKSAGQDRVNPGSLILSGAMMLAHLGWQPAANLVCREMEQTIRQKRVAYDFARLLEGATELRCSEFSSAIIENMR